MFQPAFFSILLTFATIYGWFYKLPPLNKTNFT